MGLLPETVTGGSTGHIAQTNQAWGKLNDLPNVVRDYGCVGDDSTNNTTNFQAALDAVANAGAPRGRGGTLVIPPGIYRTDKLTIAQGVHLYGLGDMRTSGAYGAVLSPRANSQTILELAGTTSVLQDGFLVEGVGFYSNGFSSVTAANIVGVNRWRFNNCSFTGAPGTPMGTGIACTDWTGSQFLDCAWWTVFETEFRRCQTGMNIAGPGGRVTNCNFVPEAAQTAETGILLRQTTATGECAQSVKIRDCMFDQSPTASFGIIDQGLGNLITGCKMEGRHTTGSGVKVEHPASANPTARLTITANGFDQYDGTAAVAVAVGANVSDTLIFGNMFSNSNAPNITDSGTRTQDFHNHKTDNTWT